MGRFWPRSQVKASGDGISFRSFGILEGLATASKGASLCLGEVLAAHGEVLAALEPNVLDKW